jgi:signal transduction histidine kinase
MAVLAGEFMAENGLGKELGKMDFEGFCGIASGSEIGIPSLPEFTLGCGQMTSISGFIQAFTLAALVVDAAADESSWDGRLAEKCSGRWSEIQRELVEISPQLEKLPHIPIADQGGTGGYASNHLQALPTADSRFAFEIRWPKDAAVDLVALVPARRYDAKGLDPQYGMPLAFTVELIDAKGAVIRVIAKETDSHRNPMRRGHPFVYHLESPVSAAGLRISADRLNSDYQEEGVFVHAWAEALVFAGDRNVALGAEVQSLSGATPLAPWRWNQAFLVDGETPLGLPEIPAAAHANIGWISAARTNANEAMNLTADLGELQSLDSVRLIPAKSPTTDLPSGFGFPRRLVISASATGESGDWKIVAERDSGNPGHNPVVLDFTPVRARFLKVEAVQSWKVFDNYPAFFALSEVEVLGAGENLAADKGFRSTDDMNVVADSSGRFWTSAALSDGFGPDGKLVTAREWILELDQRLALETRRADLLAEAGRLVAWWRRAAQIGGAVFVLIGTFLIISLPIRYRLAARRELTAVRERIAGDLHDEVGSNLGSIQMFADLAEGRGGMSEELRRIQRIAGETVSAVRDIVWLLRPTGDHRIGTVEHLRETSSIMLETLKWNFTANEEAWQTELPEAANRDLFLYFREALHNIMRHAKAQGVEIHAAKTAGTFRLVIADDGIGIDADRLARPATLRALRQRSEALQADLQIESEPEQGTRLTLSVPMADRQNRSWWSKVMRRKVA